MAAFATPEFADYTLLDSGGGEKLERLGDWVVRRPDPQALWRPQLPAEEWKQADWSFVRESDRGGRWQERRGARADSEWTIAWEEARMRVKLTAFKHVGVFPEQAANWKWVQQHYAQDTTQPTMLNLFGYTGIASILAAQSGWQVTHVDAARPSLNWAAENAALSQLDERAIRWMCDDAAAFTAREVRRGRQYDAILLDPPHYGRGPKGEKWQFERDIAGLMASCQQLLSPRAGSFLILSTYAIGYSPIAFENMLRDFGPGTIESGELVLPEQQDGRLLPCGFCARYRREG